MSNNAQTSNGAAAAAAKTYAINSIHSYRAGDPIQLEFAGKDLGLKTGDTVIGTKDGVKATFKLGRRIQSKSRYVFEAQPANIRYYRLAAWNKGEPLCFFDPHLYLTSEAAFAGVEQAIKETEDPDFGIDVAAAFDGVGVFEVSPGLNFHDPEPKQVLPKAEQAAAKTLVRSAKHQTKAGRPSPPACLVAREQIIQASLAGAERIMIFNTAAGTGIGQLLRTLAAEPGVAICAPTSAAVGLLALDGVKARTPDDLLKDTGAHANIKVIVVAEASVLADDKVGALAELAKVILFP